MVWSWIWPPMAPSQGLGLQLGQQNWYQSRPTSKFLGMELPKALKNLSWRAKTLRRCWRNVKLLRSVRDDVHKAKGHFCSLTFQLTFLEENFAEIPDIIDLAGDLGVNRVKGHHLWSHWVEMDGRAMKRDADAVRRWNDMVPVAEERAKQKGDSLTLSNSIRVMIVLNNFLYVRSLCCFHRVSP